MQKKKYFRFVIVTYFFLSISGTLFAQPSTTDYVLGYGGLAAVAASEFLFKEKLAPNGPNWIKPNSFDLFFRNSLMWEKQNINNAAFVSDLLLRGVSIPSIVWTPLISDHNYGRHLLLNIQVVSATGILTNLAKYFVGRQRPYSFFKTIKSGGVDDYLSFFSGHTSFSFAVSTSSAYILEKENPHNSALVWSSSLLLASVTGYLRVAADRHYMSDVLTGAIIGGLTGYLISKEQSKRFFKKNGSKQGSEMLFYFSLPL